MFLDETKQTLKVDVTTGDFITPAAINYSFKLLFENRSITVKAYNLETVLAEKLETILSRSTANTRMRDFYDIYVLLQTQRQNIDASVLKEAFKNTIKIRGSEYLMQDTSGQILSELKDSKAMQDLWKRYQKRYDYAKNIPWKKAVKASENLCIAISGSGPISKQGD